MRWCCTVFEGWYSQAGERGLGVLAGITPDNEPEFLIQFRAIGDGERLSVSSPEAILTETQIGILYCPWCGRKLEQWYRRDLAELDRPNLKI